MRAAVDLQNMVIEVFKAQAETGNADLFDDSQLPLGEGSGLGLKRHFLGFIPGQRFLHRRS